MSEFMLNKGYQRIMTNLPGVIFLFRQEMQSVNVILTLEYRSGVYISADQYLQIRQQLFAIFRKERVAELHMMTLVIAENRDAARRLCGEERFCWLIDKRDSALLIEEGRVEDFYGLRGMLEEFLSAYAPLKGPGGLPQSAGAADGARPGSGTGPKSGAWADGGTGPKSGAWADGGTGPKSGAWADGGTGPKSGVWADGGTKPKDGAGPGGGMEPKSGAWAGGGAGPKSGAWADGGTEVKAGRSRREALRSLPWVTILLVFSNVIVFFICTWGSGVLYNNGKLIGSAVTQRGEYYRVFTSMFLHAGLSHLSSNMIVLYFLGGMIESYLGKIRYVLLYFLAGTGAAMASVWYQVQMHSGEGSVGASGAIYGLLGALLWLVIAGKGRFKSVTLTRILFCIAYSVYSGLTATNIDNAAHIGGLIFGLISAVLLTLFQKGTDTDKKGADGT